MASCGPAGPERPGRQGSCGVRRRCGSWSCSAGLRRGLRLVRRSWRAASFPTRRKRCFRRYRAWARAAGAVRPDLFAERHFPLYAPFVEFFVDRGRGGRTARGHLAAGGASPSIWHGLRLRRPARDCGTAATGGHLGAGAAGRSPRTPSSTDAGGLRTAWLEAGRRAHPARIRWSGFRRAAYPSAACHGGGAGNTGYRGGGPGLPPGCSGRDRQLLPGPQLRRRAATTASPIPWEEEIIAEGTAEWRRARSAGGLGADGWPTGWRRTCRAGSRRCWTSSCPGCPNQQQNRRTATMTSK